MKKQKLFLYTIIITMVLLITSVISPCSVGASDTLVITKWIVNASLEDTGDLLVTEDISFRFNDTYNGVYRDIVLDGTSGISGLEVFEIKQGQSYQYRPDDRARNGDSNLFHIVNDNSSIRIKIFSPSRDEEKTFRLSYRVKDLAVRYNDTGELYYKFLGRENSTPIDLFIVNMSFPKLKSDQEIRVFAHGPDQGQIIANNNSSYSLRVKNVAKNELVEGRFLFPTSLIESARKIEKLDRLEQIIAEEEANLKRREEIRQRIRTTSKNLGTVSLGATIIILLTFLLSLILNRRKLDKRDIYEYRGDYLPAETSPAIAARLCGRTGNSETILATILDLQRRGYLTIRSLAPEGEIASDQGLDVEDFIISRIKADDQGLLSHEKRFLKWLFSEIGKGSRVKTSEVKSYADKYYGGFYQSLRAWNYKIKADANKLGYYDTGKTLYGLILLVMSLVIFALGAITLTYDNILGIGGILGSPPLFFYSIYLFTRLTDEGLSLKKKWDKFKSYMDDRLNGDYDNHDKISGLDTGLIYALALGVVNMDMGFISPEYRSIYEENNWLYWYYAFSSGNSSSFHKSFSESFDRPLSSSGSGFSSGGFSGGGGGGAGGGGAGGF